MVMPKGPRPHLWQRRFDKMYIPEPNSGCWLWTAALRMGYGCFHAYRVDTHTYNSLRKMT